MNPKKTLLMGNEALAQGALEAGVTVATGYPGTPSSEIIETLANHTQDNLYVEWSINEKVALEVAAAASLAGLRSVCVMKQNGVNVASDFLLHLAISGTRGGIVLITCDDPGALSSMNEQDSRYFAKLVEIPLLEPATFQHAIDMTKWAFDLSEILKTIVMVRSTTRLSHGMGTVIPGALPDIPRKAHFEHDGPLLDYETGPVTCAPVVKKHEILQKKLEKAHALFNSSPFNVYTGPEKPDLLVITSGVATLYSKEAVHNLNLSNSVGVLSIGTTYPLPVDTIIKYLSTTEAVLFVEEVAPFIEESVKALIADVHDKPLKFYGKNNVMPKAGELNPDIVTNALSTIFDIPVIKKDISTLAPQRKLTFCAGCPHRASLWSIHKVLEKNGQYGFVCGDIGCYTMDIFSEFRTIKTIHSMGSGIGLASGFGKLDQFGLDQPVLAVCGDSTFFHAAIPALINAVHNSSNLILVVLDNKGTAMTGFQPHPGLPVDAVGNKAPSVDIADVCKGIGADVTVVNPFDLEKTQKILHDLMKKSGVRVLVLSQVCALSSEKKEYTVYVDENLCKGGYGCNKPCTQMFCCPGLVWDKEKEVTCIDEVICVGCGVCVDICPVGAIKKEEIP
jgi:indolepyruvate ferredoxin oxidoreductase alpha subunit